MRTEIYRDENGGWRWRYKPVESPEERAKRQARNSRVFFSIMLGFWLVFLGQEIWEGQLTNSSAAMIGSQIALAIGGIAKDRKIQIAFTVLATAALVMNWVIK